MKRCNWKNLERSQLYIDYHDYEWGIPSYDDNRLFEMFILESFHCGLSWLTILKKRESFRKAFDQFDAVKIANYSEEKIEELLANKDIVRNKAKILATIQNAKAYLQVVQEFGSFSNYLWGFTDYHVVYGASDGVVTKNELSDRVSKDLKKRGFKFMGTVTCYSYLEAIGIMNNHARDCFKYTVEHDRNKLNIVFLDVDTLGGELDLSEFDSLGNVVKYGFTKTEEIPERVKDANVIILNKVPINEMTVGTAKHLQMVCMTGTGTNHIDKAYLEQRGVVWRNVEGYSTESVTQHTFAMLFYLMEHLRFYDDYVKQEEYVQDEKFQHYRQSFHDLSGKTWGIIGLGAIGRRVADIGAMFGSKIIYYSASGAKKQEGYQQVSLDTLLRTSDIISIHAPLNQYTEGLIDCNALKKMKHTAILLNVGRGAIVVEEDLVTALESGTIAAAGIDVLAIEPMEASSPYLRIKDSNKLLVTPHIAWASVESRTNLMHIIYEQIKDYLSL